MKTSHRRTWTKRQRDGTLLCVCVFVWLLWCLSCACSISLGCMCMYVHCLNIHGSMAIAKKTAKNHGFYVSLYLPFLSLSLHFCDSLGVFSLVLPHCVTLYGHNSGTSLAEWFHLRRFLLLTWHSTSTSYITNLNPFLRLFCSFWRETKKMSFLASQIGNIHHCSWWVLWTSHKLCLHCFLLEKRRKTIW